MSDREAFLAEIFERPDEDAIRLIFADWLEEDNRAAADQRQAEFIRTQIELANSWIGKMINAGTLVWKRDGIFAWAERRKRLLARESDLMPAGSMAFRVTDRNQRYMAPVKITFDIAYRRGFIFRAGYSGPLEHLPVAFQLGPLEEINYFGAWDRDASLGQMTITVKKIDGWWQLETATNPMGARGTAQKRFATRKQMVDGLPEFVRFASAQTLTA